MIAWILDPRRAYHSKSNSVIITFTKTSESINDRETATMFRAKHDIVSLFTLEKLVIRGKITD